ncbi:hypothetical protein AVDCRST_MAG81-3892 [uncultured Synechococcales cyanobacterium]|uniref:Uncharacterized protein n=1 Tax=uncultured Synechococcales cyanobacterium TaxID=1936017 RepID=A0A6J4VS88_9CYAN|nr:hypothetical protein AVDCRST_MAG81-3892 [uncultured Synechococcales cyanobacterium]
MDYLLASWPVALLPQEFSSLGRRLADPKISYIHAKAKAALAFCPDQPLGKPTRGLATDCWGSQWVDPRKSVLGLFAQVAAFLRTIGLKSNLNSLQPETSPAPNKGLARVGVELGVAQ